MAPNGAAFDEYELANPNGAGVDEPKVLAPNEYADGLGKGKLDFSEVKDFGFTDSRFLSFCSASANAVDTTKSPMKAA